MNKQPEDSLAASVERLRQLLRDEPDHPDAEAMKRDLAQYEDAMTFGWRLKGEARRRKKQKK